MISTVKYEQEKKTLHEVFHIIRIHFQFLHHLIYFKKYRRFNNFFFFSFLTFPYVYLCIALQGAASSDMYQETYPTHNRRRTLSGEIKVEILMYTIHGSWVGNKRLTQPY